MTGVPGAMSIGFVPMALASPIWSSLSDRFEARLVVVAGSVLLAGSLAVTSRAESLVEFQVLFGLLVGVSAAAVYVPVMAVVTGWFDTNRSLAVSPISAGMGMAPLTMSPLAVWLVTRPVRSSATRSTMARMWAPDQQRDMRACGGAG